MALGDDGAMNLNDLAKYATESFVRSFEDRPSRKRVKEPASSRWFGLLPMAIRIMMRRLQR